MAMPTDQELWEIQSKVTEVLLKSGTEPQEWQLRDAAQLLSGTLREIVDDQPFWTEVGRSTPNDESVRLAAVLAVDWPFVFEARGYAEKDSREQAADALGTASEVVISESVEWEHLRTKMSALSDRLAEDAKDGATHDRRWWNRLRDRIGFGLGAVRRVSVKKLFIELGKGAAQNVVAALVSGAVGGPAFAPALFGVLVGRLAIALADELVRGWTEESDFRESARLRAMVRESPLFHVSRLDQVTLVKAADLPEFEVILDRLRRWVARVGLDLVNAWSHVVTHLGRQGADVLAGMFTALQTIRAALAPFLTAKKDQYAALAAEADTTIRRALDALDVRATALTTMLFASGVLEKP